MNRSQEDKWDEALTVEQVSSGDRLAMGSDVVPAAGVFLKSGLSWVMDSIGAGTPSECCRGPYCVLAVETLDGLRARGPSALRVEDGVSDWWAYGLEVEIREAAARWQQGPNRRDGTTLFIPLSRAF